MDNSSTRVPGVSSSWLWPGPAPAVMGIWGNELADGRSADGRSLSVLRRRGRKRENV